MLLICRFTPTCPEIVRILSLGMDKQLSLMMRMKLRIHYLMCSFCQRYMKQLKYIREVSREFPDKIGEVSDASLSADAKERIKAVLRAIKFHSEVTPDPSRGVARRSRPTITCIQRLVRIAHSRDQ